MIIKKIISYVNSYGLVRTKIYVNLSGLVRTKISPSNFFCRYNFLCPFIWTMKIKYILCQFIWSGMNKNWGSPIFIVNITSMSFYLDWYYKKYLMSIYLDWNKQKLGPPSIFLSILLLCPFIWSGAPLLFFVNFTLCPFILTDTIKKYLSYVNLSGLVRTKIAPLLFF